METFKHIRTIPGYPLYLVTRDGQIISCKHEQPRTLKPYPNQKGYLYVILYRNGRKPKHMLIHRAVALAFLENRGKKQQVNHINGIKTDNRLENLQWCTPSENLKHAFATGLKKNPGKKLNRDDVCGIRQAHKNGATCADLGRAYGVL